MPDFDSTEPPTSFAIGTMSDFDSTGAMPEPEAGRDERLLQPLVERVPVACVQFCALDPLRRILGVEVEREPHHLGVEPALEPLGRGLADAAERSDVVRPDEDGGSLVHAISRASRSSIVSRRRMRRALPPPTSTAAGRGTAL